MTVFLVGAGPGDPGLLTVRGCRVLEGADVVVHDRLADPTLLDMAPERAERIDVGKRPGGPVDQDRINRLLIERARRGLNVVRLKGGDPFVFGRGGEEAQALLDEGIDFEMVPGVTSAAAVPAYAGVPLTHRGLSACFSVVTGHSRQSLERDVDWKSLARVGGTIVVLMGVAHRREIAARLMEGGLAAETPVIAVTWGTRPEQTSVRTTLRDLGATPMDPPATIVVGAVAGLNLSWFERRPLRGWRVVVTRSAAQASELAGMLSSVGAVPVEVPLIEVGEPSDGGLALREAAGRLGSYEWVVFGSGNGVEAVMGQVRDARAFGAARIAAVGFVTANVLARHALAADLVPESFVAEAVLEAFPAPGGSRRVLVPRPEGARDVLPAGLRRRGWQVDEVEAYATSRVKPPADRLEDIRRAQAITFTSASTVRSFVETAGVDSVPPRVACIGPVTAQAAEEAGLSVDVVARDHTMAGLVEALIGLATAEAP